MNWINSTPSQQQLLSCLVQWLVHSVYNRGLRVRIPSSAEKLRFERFESGLILFKSYNSRSPWPKFMLTIKFFLTEKSIVA